MRVKSPVESMPMRAHPCDDRAVHRGRRPRWSFVPSFFALGGLALVLAPASAFAQTATVEQVQEAQERYREGRRLYEEGRLAEAHMKFSQACAVERTVNCSKNLGIVEFDMGRYAEATTHLREFLREARRSGAGLSAEQMDKVQRMQDDAYRRCAHVQVSAPSGARIFVDQRDVGVAPLSDPIDLAAGESVTVEARAPHETLRQSVRVGAGELVQVRFVEKTEYPAPVSTDRPGSSSPRTITLVSLYGVALVGAGAGIALVLHSQARSNDADGVRNGLGGASNRCNGISGSDPAAGQCAQLQSLRDTYDTDRKWAKVSFIGAGVFAAAATTLFFAWPVRREDRPAKEGTQSGGGRFVPLVGPGLRGVGYSARF
ncbi:MAG TPA: hypothetical protein VNO21_12465 [Polyangiaceae bacterium]|nr:hypothetical protein [Polyangiaceae bacterium]